MNPSRLQKMTLSLLETPLVPMSTLDELRAGVRRRRRIRLGMATAVPTVAVVVVLVTQVLLPSTGKSTRTLGSHLTAYIAKGVSIPDSVLQEIGLPAGGPTNTSALQGQPPLISGGLPVVVYVGAEFCPYCAIQRWALLVALSRFGTFSNLGQLVSSSSTDVDPNIESWSFHGSSYSSKYLSFEPAEVETSTHVSGPNSGYTPLDTLSPLQRQVFDAYDLSGGIPWIDFANSVQMLGPGANPAVLEGLSLGEIAGDLSDPTSPVAQAVDGTANYMIASICSFIYSTGVPICSAPFVTQAHDQIFGGS